MLTGHSASVNVVRWGGENVIYTGSSDRTVKVWSGVDVSRVALSVFLTLYEIGIADGMQGKLIRTLSEHAHWVNTMALSTDFVLRTGPYDHTSKKPKDDIEGTSFFPTLDITPYLPNRDQNAYIIIKQAFLFFWLTS